MSEDRLCGEVLEILEEAREAKPDVFRVWLRVIGFMKENPTKEEVEQYVSSLSEVFLGWFFYNFSPGLR